MTKESLAALLTVNIMTNTTVDAILLGISTTLVCAQIAAVIYGWKKPLPDEVFYFIFSVPLVALVIAIIVTLNQ